MTERFAYENALVELADSLDVMWIGPTIVVRGRGAGREVVTVANGQPQFTPVAAYLTQLSVEGLRSSYFYARDLHQTGPEGF